VLPIGRNFCRKSTKAEFFAYFSKTGRKVTEFFKCFLTCMKTLIISLNRLVSPHTYPTFFATVLNCDRNVCLPAYENIMCAAEYFRQWLNFLVDLAKSFARSWQHWFRGDREVCRAEAGGGRKMWYWRHCRNNVPKD
jgi:hypothetical protein